MENKMDVQEAVNSLLGLALVVGMMGEIGKKPLDAKDEQTPSDETPSQQLERIEAVAHKDVEELMDECFSNGVQVFFYDFPDDKDDSSWCEYDEQYRGKPHTYASVRDVSGVESEGVAAMAEGDTYSKDIGRAIALRRAMKKPVPKEYFKAGALLSNSKPVWEKRPAKPGETIRITTDKPHGADVRKGEVLTVASCLPPMIGSIMTKARSGDAHPWAIHANCYEVKNV